MKKKTSLLINLALVLTVFVSSFFMMGVYNQSCDGSITYSDIIYENNFSGFTTSTQNYSGSTVTAVDINCGNAASIPICVDMTMQGSYLAQDVYDVNSGNINFDSSFVSNPYGITIAPTTHTDVAANPVIFTAAISIPGNISAGVYRIPLNFTITNKPVGNYQINPITTAIYIAIKSMQNAPVAPTVQLKTTNSVTLTQLSGAEYSDDGTNWQENNIFTGLSPNTSYTFFQRLKETDTAFVSLASAGTTVTTNKTSQNAPAAPTVQSKTESSVTLTPTPGMKYSKDGTTWQESNIFTGLLPNKTYTFYQCYTETENEGQSPASDGTNCTTSNMVTISGNLSGSDQASYTANVTAQQMGDGVNLTVNLGNVSINDSSSALNSALGTDTTASIMLKQSPSSASEQDLEAKISGQSNSIVCSTEIDLYKVLPDGTSTQIHQLGSRVMVTLLLANAQKAAITNPSTAKMFYYDPSTDSLVDMKATFDINAGTVSFYSDHFSTFVLVQLTSDNPKTGDETQSLLGYVLLSISATAILAAFRKRAKSIS